METLSEHLPRMRITYIAWRERDLQLVVQVPQYLCSMLGDDIERAKFLYDLNFVHRLVIEIITGIVQIDVISFTSVETISADLAEPVVRLKGRTAKHKNTPLVLHGNYLNNCQQDWLFD